MIETNFRFTKCATTVEQCQVTSRKISICFYQGVLLCLLHSTEHSTYVLTNCTKFWLTHTTRVNTPLFGPRYLNPCKQVSPKKLEIPSTKGDKILIVLCYSRCVIGSKQFLGLTNECVNLLLSVCMLMVTICLPFNKEHERNFYLTLLYLWCRIFCLFFDKMLANTITPVL